jgi:hypothetical protein
MPRVLIPQYAVAGVARVLKGRGPLRPIGIYIEQLPVTDRPAGLTLSFGQCADCAAALNDNFPVIASIFKEAK